MAFQCFDDPVAILDKAFCVSAVSKDLKGTMKRHQQQRAKMFDTQLQDPADGAQFES